MKPRAFLTATLVVLAVTAWAASGLAAAPGAAPAPRPAPASPAAAPSDLPGVPVPPSAVAPAAPPPPAAASPTAEAPAAPAPGAGRPTVSAEDLRALYKEAVLIIQFQAETVQAKPEIVPRLVWEVRGPLVETLKGNLLPGQLALHVDSVVRIFDLPRTEVEGKQFVASVKPLAEVGTRRFQLVGAYAFPADSKEAEALRQLAEADVEKGSGSGTLELVVRPLEKVFPVSGPKVVELRLTNTGPDSATYLQTPVTERDGRLYLTGQGQLRVRDITGRIVPDRGNVIQGQPPPPPPTPALILPKASFVETLDLSKYFELSEGRYTLLLTLATPDGRGRIAGTGFTFQVGAVNLPPEPVKTAVGPTETAPKPPTPAVTGGGAGAGAVRPPAPPPTVVDNATIAAALAATQPKTAAPALDLPDPAKYQPGRSTAGLAGLLRPTKAKFALGDPVEVELRLINVGPRSVAVDARLERTLSIQVQPIGESPQPLVIRQVIPWPPDAVAMPEERSFLREGAFWGRIINLNTLFGKNLEEMPPPTPEEIAAGKALSYERFGKNLFGFPKPGVYTVTATYTVSRPRTPSAEGQPSPELPKEWWVGDLTTNTITIQVGEVQAK